MLCKVIDLKSIGSDRPLGVTLKDPRINAQSAEPRDCAKLRIEHDWSRAEYRACQREETQQNIDRLDAEFAKMREWLRSRGLDVTAAGIIVDPEGRTLAQIETSNAAVAADNAVLRANIEGLELRIVTADAEYQRILQEFEQAILQRL
jgi:hypothetical protein